MFIYPENLKAKPMLWLWELRDIGIIGVGFLLSVLALSQGAGMIHSCYVYSSISFLTIRCGRLQHPGLFTKGRLFPNPAAAILRMEA